MSLFKKASKKARRLKMYIYGESGSGKTVTSLHFPSPAMIDAEKGTDFYGELFDFERIQTNDPDEINAALDELLKDPGDVKTLILDPFTAVYEAMQDAQLRRMRVKNNNKNYTLQPVDFKLLKSNVKGLIQKLLALDLNIICTARARVEYSQEPGEFMKPVGLKPDGPKDLPYMFDVVLELKETPDGKRLASTIKDRTNTLPNSFEFSYEQFVKYLGNADLERDPVVFNQQTSLDDFAGRQIEIEFKGNKIKTAGITAEQLVTLSALIENKGLSSDTVAEKLREGYMIESLLDLKPDEAKLLIDELSK